jgi:hypothetical protein
MLDADNATQHNANPQEPTTKTQLPSSLMAGG